MYVYLPVQPRQARFALPINVQNASPWYMQCDSLMMQSRKEKYRNDKEGRQARRCAPIYGDRAP